MQITRVACIYFGIMANADSSRCAMQPDNFFSKRVTGDSNSGLLQKSVLFTTIQQSVWSGNLRGIFVISSR